MQDGAHDLNRTSKGISSQRILSPSRLPVPPRGHYYAVGNPFKDGA